jgi:hypothetical protein
MLLALGFAASATSNAIARVVEQPAEKEKKKDLPIRKGTVVGTLTVNGEVTKLKYVYARRRTAPPPVDVGLYFNGGDSKDVIDVIITNQPLTEVTLTSIQEDKYHGADKIRGINLIIMSSGEHKWVTYFLLQSRIVRPGGMTTYRGNPQFETGKVTGQIEYKNYGLDVRTYSVSFDAPL